MDEQLPKQELLIKMLGMTLSDNDGQALVAIRKANALLVAAGWDWEKLINGRITVVADPFASIPTPPAAKAAPAPTPRPYQPPPAAAPFKPHPLPIHSTRPNSFPGHCFCCGYEQMSQTAFIFKPKDYLPNGSDRWQVICEDCNKTRTTIFPFASQPVRGKRKKSISDLA